MKKRLLTSVFSCLVALSLTACNSNAPNDTKYSDTSANDTGNISVSEDANSKFIPLDIAESGYTMIEGGFLYCAVKVHNPNTGLAILYPTVRITARDTGGTLLGTQDQTLSTIYPQQDFWYSGQLLQVDTAPSSVEFTIVQPDDYNIVSASTLEQSTFTPLSVENTAMHSERLVGEVVNKNDFDLDMIVVAAVFRNENGDIIGGESTFVDKLPASGSVPFDMPIHSEFANCNYEVYANGWA
jgi:lipoprotein